MFAIVQNGVIIKRVQPDVGFELGGIFYPANWCNLSTPEEKAAIGMVDVVQGERLDDRYYWVSENGHIYNAETNQVEVIVVNTPKDLDQLKANVIAQIKQTANAMLSPTDWKVIRSQETGTALDAPTLASRAAIRTASNTNEAAVNGCTTVAELAAVQLIWPEQE
jgi:hypothetical protein